MQRAMRFALVGLALVGAVVAFVVLRPEGEEAGGGAVQTVTEPFGGTTSGGQAGGIGATTTAPAQPDEPAEPAEIRVHVRGLKPLGGIADVRVRKGELVRLRVTSDVPEEVHIHGYDLSKPVARGRPARFRFAARIEGVFEIELEDAGVEIARLVVSP